MAFCEASASKLLVLHTAACARRRDGPRLRDRGRGRGGARGRRWSTTSGPTRSTCPPGPFVIYQGSHGDRGAHRADVILPGAAWAEEPGIYVNTEGRPQMANRAGFPPGDARENWAILRALSAQVGTALPFDSLAALRAQMVAAGAASRRDRPGAGKRMDPAGAGGYVGRRFRLGGAGALPREPGAAGERGDGGSRAARQRAHPPDGGGVGDGRRLLHPRLRAVPADPGAVPAGHRHHSREPRVPDVRGPQGLGGGAAAPRAERGRAVGAAAELRRPAEVRRSRKSSSRRAPTRRCSSWRRWSPSCCR